MPKPNKVDGTDRFRLADISPTHRRRTAEIKDVLYPGPRPHFRVLVNLAPEESVYLVNEQPVSKETFDRLQETYWIPGVSRILMDVGDCYDCPEEE